MHVYSCFKILNQISFTLYPAHSRVGRENLVLRYSVPHFLPNSGGIACWVTELNAALNLDTRVKKWKYKFKEIFHLLEWGSNPQPVGFTITLCATAPRLASIQYYKVVFYMCEHIFKILKIFCGIGEVISAQLASSERHKLRTELDYTELILWKVQN